MRQSSLERIAPLLAVLRAHPTLHEIRPTEFLLDGKMFLHFHDEADGVVADVLLTKGRVSMPVSSASDQAELLDRIDRSLSSLASRERDRQRRRRPQRQRQAGRPSAQRARATDVADALSS